MASALFTGPTAEIFHHFELRLRAAGIDVVVAPELEFLSGGCDYLVAHVAGGSGKAATVSNQQARWLELVESARQSGARSVLTVVTLQPGADLGDTLFTAALPPWVQVLAPALAPGCRLNALLIAGVPAGGMLPPAAVEAADYLLRGASFVTGATLQQGWR